MTDKQVSQLTAVSALTAADLLHVVQSGNSRKATAAQMATLVGSQIIENGSNTNGEYIRFADGTQICLKTITDIGPIDVATGTLYASTGIALGSWAASFSSTPLRSVSSSKSATGSLIYYGTGPTTTSAGVVYLMRHAASSAIDFSIQAIAIGRWF